MGDEGPATVATAQDLGAALHRAETVLRRRPDMGRHAWRRSQSARADATVRT